MFSAIQHCEPICTVRYLFPSWSVTVGASGQKGKKGDAGACAHEGKQQHIILIIKKKSPFRKNVETQVFASLPYKEKPNFILDSLIFGQRFEFVEVLKRDSRTTGHSAKRIFHHMYRQLRNLVDTLVETAQE